MKKLMKGLSLGVLTMAVVLGVALLLPQWMGAVMADTIGTTTAFPQHTVAPLAEGQQVTPTQEAAQPAVTVTPLPIAAQEGDIPTMPPAVFPVAADPAEPVHAPQQEEAAPDEQQAVGTLVRVLPTPMPMTPLAGADVAPTAWRQLLKTQTTDDLRARLSSDSAELLGEMTAPELERFSVLMAGKNTLLAEDLLPRDLANQKLLSGLMDNLNSPAIYVPHRDVLDRLMNLQLRAFTLSQDREIAGMQVNGRIRLPLRVLEAASMNSEISLTPERYMDLRDNLMRDAQRVMDDSDIALQASLDLVAKMMHDEKPWELAVIGVAPYQCQPDWDYYTFGHHVRTVDMRTGKGYTLTTNLDSQQVIGIAQEGTEPFLATYQVLVEAARRVNAGEQGQTQAGRLQMLELLAGIPFSQQAAQWELTYGHNAQIEDGKDLMADHQSIQARPADADTRMVDPQGQMFLTYALELDANQKLLSYTRTYAPSLDSSGWLIGYAVSPEERNLGYQRATDYYRKEAPQVLPALEHVWKNADALMKETLDLSVFRAEGMSLVELTAIGVLQDNHAYGGDPVFYIATEARVQDDQGRQYQMMLSTDLNLDTQVGSVVRQEQ